MSAVTPLRPARSAALPPLSPEREHLAATIERYAEAQARLDRITEAQDRARNLSSQAFFEAEAIERELDEAKTREPRRLIASLLGDAPEPGRSVADIAHSLSEVRAARSEFENARSTLAGERQAAEQSLSLAISNRNAAMSEALRASLGLARLLSEFADARRRYASLRAALKWLAAQPRNALSELQRSGLEAHVDGWPADPAPILGQWEPAVAALQHDAAAPLPGDNMEAA